MANLLRGAINLLGGADLAGATEQGRLVGKSIVIDGKRYNVRAQIAKGGFATVYTCQQAESGAWYALKSQLAGDAAAAKVIQQELKLLRESSHPHIVHYVGSVMGAGTASTSSKEFLMITELCSGGSVIDLLAAGNPLTLAQVANITHGATAAIAYLHARPVPVTHRDMKVENLLFSSRGFVKLCDFGSATTEECAPDDTWNAARRTQLEENAQLATTPMYRAPEILDTYLGYPVGRLQDVWALGCVLFYLCYRSHPFEDSAKLRIIYAKYAIPEEEGRYAPFRPLIESTLKPDPRQRPSAADLQQRIEALAVALDVRVDTAVPGIDTTALTGGEPVGGGGGDERRTERRGEGAVERRERTEDVAAAAAAAPPVTAAGGGQTSTAFSQLRGQGLSMFRNLKEKSAAVMQTVQNTYGSKGPELVWLTSRIVIAPQQLEGVPEPLAAQAEESLRAALSALRRPYKMINLAQRRLRCEYPEAATDVAFPADGAGGQPPPMDSLLAVAHAAGIYLRQAPADAYVVLVGSEVHSSLAALSLLVYHRVLRQPWCAIELLQEKRPGTPVLLPPSSHRLLDALHKSVQPHFKQIRRDARLQLVQLVVEHLPTFNNNRTGARPLLMVYVGGTALWTPQPYEMIRAYEGPAERARVQFGLKKSLVAGDVCVVLYHARMSSLTQRMHQIPMVSFNLHTALVEAGSNSVELRKGDLDFAPADEQFVPEDIKITLTFSHREPAASAPAPPGAARGFYDYPADIVAPRHVVGSTAELQEMQARFEGGGAAKKQQPSAPAAPAAAAAAAEPAPSQPSGGFFDSLSWDAAPAAAAAAAAASPPPPPPHRAASLAAPAAAAAPAAMSDRFESMVLDPKETPILGKNTSPNTTMSVVDVRGREEYREEEEIDLLGMGSAAPARPQQQPAAAAAPTANLLFDPFDTVSSATVKAPAAPQTLDDLFGGVSSSSSSSLNKPQSHRDLDDLFGLGGGGGSASAGGGGKTNGAAADLLMGDLLGGGGSGSSMHRNASAPSFAAPKKEEKRAGGGGGGGGFDPFADFLASTPAPAAASSANSTRSSTPSMAAQQASVVPPPPRPNYSRSAFDALNATGMPAKPRPSANAFDDLLSAQGFSASGGGAGGMGKTMGDMRRAEEIRDLTPEQIKIRDWTAGKERNIRALLASLSEVLWADDPRWQQPSMASLLSANEVKKYYRKAAIVVHPDKQTGLPHAELAKAIMGELITAWNAFEDAGAQSLA